MKAKVMIRIAKNPQVKDAPEEIEAKQVLGCLAITRRVGISKRPIWKLTHIPTGYVLCSPNSLAQARAMLKSLGNHPEIARLTKDSASKFAQTNPLIIQYLYCRHHDTCTLAEFIAANGEPTGPNPFGGAETESVSA